MSMAGTEREPESTAPDVSVVTGLIRSGKSSMPKSTIYHRAQSLCRAWSCVSPFSSGGGVKTNNVRRNENAKFSILSLSICAVLAPLRRDNKYIKNGQTDHRLHNNSCAWP